MTRTPLIILVTSFSVAGCGSVKPDAKFVARLDPELRKLGLDPATSKIDDGLVVVYCYAPRTEDGMKYAVEILYRPGSVIECGARPLDPQSTKLDELAFRKPDVAGAWKHGSSPVTRSERSKCPDGLYAPFQKLFDEIIATVERVASGG